MLTNLTEKANRTNCACGRAHAVDMGDIIIRPNALDDIGRIVQQVSPGRRVAMVCDTNTYRAAGERLELMLEGTQVDLTTCVIRGEEPIVPDEKTLGTVLLAIEPGTQCLIAVGSGTINDIVRHVAYKMSIPFIAVGTAPSMDGYASSISSLVVDGVKTTVQGKLPAAIVGDTEVLSKAPEHMKAAGFGDLIGKVIARMDWRLAHMVNGEYICEYTIGLVQDALRRCIDALQSSSPDASSSGGAQASRSGSQCESGSQCTSDSPYSDETVSAIMEGLVVSGLAIAMVGISRAASGAEHHISHFLEMKALTGEAPAHLHGEKVSLGTYIMSTMYHKVFSHDFAEIERLMAAPPRPQSPERRVARLTEVYGRTAPAMIQRWRSNLPGEARAKYIKEYLSANWERLQQMVLHDIPKPAELTSLLDAAKSPYRFQNMGYSRDLVEDAIVCSKEISQKYSLLYILDEIGLLEHFAHETVEDLA